MRVKRGLVFWGVGLVTAGAVALAIQSDLIAADVARDAWRFWPVVLIVIGLAVIAARTPFALVATLASGLVAGALVGTLVAADVAMDLNVTANAGSSKLGLSGMDFSDLSVDMNAGDIDIDLAGTSAAQFSASANAGSLSLVVDTATAAAGSLSVTAGSVELCVADGTAIEVTVNDSNITFGHNLDDSGLDRSGDTWRSGDGPADVTLQVEGNAASFTYNPTGGCS